MKKLLILTLTFIITTSSFIGCNNTQPNEPTKQTSEDSSTNKQEVKETPEQTVEKANNDPKKVDSEQSKQTEATTPKKTKNQTSNADNQSSKNNTESKTKETSNNTLKFLGNYSKDKLYIDSKNNLYGFIVRDLKIKKPNIDNFKYNEVIATYGKIKYPNFLKLNNKFIPVNFAGFQFTDSTNLIKFEFNCDESYIDPETNKSYSVDYIYKILTDTSINSKCKITYKAKGKDWVCVSSEGNGIITCYFVKLKKDMNTSFSYTYPKKYEKLFNPIIQQSYNSFKTDDIVKNN
ncbi:hypothetical protein [Clostridium sp.]|uniref:hypothetical protein n=1 Tax=Clostridium sp. TaxID=1506 RepID=UPI002601D27E|nr:hypothetical protein [Clostridium sp.]